MIRKMHFPPMPVRGLECLWIAEMEEKVRHDKGMKATDWHKQRHTVQSFKCDGPEACEVQWVSLAVSSITQWIMV